DVLLETEVVRGAAPTGSNDAERVSIVDQEAGAVLFHHRHDLVELGNLAFRAEDAVSDDERAFTVVEVLERARKRFRVVLLVTNQLRASSLPEPHAVIE